VDTNPVVKRYERQDGASGYVLVTERGALMTAAGFGRMLLVSV